MVLLSRNILKKIFLIFANVYVCVSVQVCACEYQGMSEALEFPGVRVKIVVARQHGTGTRNPSRALCQARASLTAQ